jgi:hypothetical protein
MKGLQGILRVGVEKPISMSDYEKWITKNVEK